MKVIQHLFLWLAVGVLAQADTFSPFLIRGEVAPKGDYPASVWVGNCTATVIGPRTVLIAAHCASTGKVLKFTAGGMPHTAKCTSYPGYKGNDTYDWTLCLSPKDIGVTYENVNSDPTLMRVGDVITLSGYGCRTPGGAGGIDGKYRIGKATINRLPSKNSADIITNKGSALCYGDSGGPAFYGEGNSRKVISVNSRGDISKTSYLVSLSHPKAVAFLEEWDDSNPICGLSAKKGCR